MWLDLIGLSQYEQLLIDAGYDDIDFISDISSEELEDIGITKKGEWRGCGFDHVIMWCVCVCVCRPLEAFYAWHC